MIYTDLYINMVDYCGQEYNKIMEELKGGINKIFF